MKTSCVESSEKNYRLSIRKYEKEHSRNIDNLTCYGPNNARDEKLIDNCSKSEVRNLPKTFLQNTGGFTTSRLPADLRPWYEMCKLDKWDKPQINVLRPN